MIKADKLDSSQVGRPFFLFYNIALLEIQYKTF